MCSYFLSKANNCKLYKTATVTAFTTSPETNAGICPKYDSSQAWLQYYPPEMPLPGKNSWCGEESGSICTFPFSLKFTGSVLYYEPYKDASGKSWCGTKFDALVPVEYSDVDELESAVPCMSE